jgi:regulator of sigma E protease
MFDFLLQNDTLSAVIAFGLVLIPLVFIHELGHFLAAKAVGITVLEFGIGFPPRAVTLFRRGATEYTLNWLPIGGFVRPLGEDFVKPVSAEEMERDKRALRERIAEDEEAQGDAFVSERAALRARGVEKMMSVNEARPAGRILFMSAGALANLVTAFFIFMVIAVSGVPTEVGSSAVVTDTQPGTSWSEAGLQRDDVITHVNGTYFANGVVFPSDIEGSESVTLTVLREGVSQDINVMTNVEEGQTTPNIYVFVSAVAANSPASNAGIQPYDMITAFNAEPFSAFEELPRRTQAMLGEEVTLTLVRNGGEPFDVTVVPRENPPQDEGSIGIGIRPGYNVDGLLYAEGPIQRDMIPLAFGDSIGYAWGRVSGIISEFVQLPARIISGAVSAEEVRPVSFVGMSQIGAVFLQESIEQGRPVIILDYIAIISILLGLTQLLPLPMLDGGRILFVLIEIVRGRPIAPEREGLVHLIGMAFLLSVMVLTVLNDFLNPITNMIP